MKLLEKTIQEVRPIDPRWIDSASQRQLELTKPAGSLGRLEEIANRCAAIREPSPHRALRRGSRRLRGRS
jgi:nicotinate-nucleotide--dimethylbenzimidazole phosphoribosyltransferase